MGMIEVTIYTDGGCYPNPGPGGWGAVIHHHKSDTKLEVHGGLIETTNNQMELTAAIRGLAELKRSCRVELITDSKYLKNGITRWVPKWRTTGWINSEGKPVKNRELWEELWELEQEHTIRWRWVRGHTGTPGNERADKLATLGRRAIIREKERESIAFSSAV